MVKVSQKKNCNRCRFHHISANDEMFCEIGCSVENNSGIGIPKEPCPKPLTMFDADEYLKSVKIEEEQDFDFSVSKVSEIEDECSDEDMICDVFGMPFFDYPENCENDQSDAEVLDEVSLWDVFNLDFPDFPRDHEKNRKSKPVKTRYLIDTENMGKDWLRLLDQDHPNAIYYLFETSESTNIPLSKLYLLSDLIYQNRLIVISCNRGTPNALDFQLVFFMGILCEQYPDDIYVIVSKDKGYDAVVNNTFLTRNRAFRDDLDVRKEQESETKNESKFDLEPEIVPSFFQPIVRMKEDVIPEIKNKLTKMDCPGEILNRTAEIMFSVLQNTKTQNERRAEFYKNLINACGLEGQKFYNAHARELKTSFFEIGM